MATYLSFVVVLGTLLEESLKSLPHFNINLNNALWILLIAFLFSFLIFHKK